MIKSVAYFPSQCALNSGPVINAVLDSLQAAGIQTQENSMTADAAVIWSVLWSGRMAGNQAVYEHYRRQNKPVIVVEIGALYRGNTWKIAVNNITAEGYYGHLDNLDPDRPAKLKISLAVQSKTRPEIVIALQHARSLQVQNVNLVQWTEQTIKSLRQHTDRPIVVRQHPRSRLSLPVIAGVTVETPQKIINTYDSYNMHYNCHAVVNYNSGPGLQAAIAGVRPIVDATSLASPVGINLADIEQPYDIDRYQWLTQICHTEYTTDEITQGIWLNRIAPALG